MILLQLDSKWSIFFAGENMIHKIAQYEIHSGQEDFIRAAIKDFVAAIRENEEETIYKVYETGTRQFVHIMTYKDEVAEELHKNAAYTILFVSKLYPKCVKQPKFQSLNHFQEAP